MTWWTHFPCYWHFYQTRSAWSVDQGSTRKRSPVHNFAPAVTKFCVRWEGLSLPHDTKFSNCRSDIIDRRVIITWSLIHGSSWSGLIKVGPGNQPATGGFPSQRADKPELWYHVFFFIFSCWVKQAVEPTVTLPLIWDAMMFMWCHSNEKQRSFKTSQSEINYWILFYKCMGLDPLMNHAEDVYGFYRSFSAIILNKIMVHKHIKSVIWYEFYNARCCHKTHVVLLKTTFLAYDNKVMI